MLVAFVVLWLVAGYAYLLSGMVGLFLLVFTPDPGADTPVFVLKAALVVGWLAIGAWHCLQLFRGRWRFVFAPIAGWTWIGAVGAMLGNFASLNWGY